MCCRCRVQESSVIDFFTGQYYWKRKEKKKKTKQNKFCCALWSTSVLITVGACCCRRRQNLDRTRSDHGPDHELNHGPDQGLDHRSDHVSWKQKFCVTSQNSDKPKVCVTWWNAGPTGIFLQPKTPSLSRLYRGVLWSATMNEGKRDVSIIS